MYKEIVWIYKLITYVFIYKIEQVYIFFFFFTFFTFYCC